MRKVVIVAGLLASAAHAQGSAPVVRVDGGALQGVAVPSGSGVQEFRGVPFAAPPVGPLRWRKPQPVAHWSGVRSAAAFGARCMQQPLYDDMIFRSPPPSEDCLYLNVWTPANLRHAPAAKLPVLVYVYGGGFVTGDASEKRYDGAAMAARGIVVVTMNYRLGVFGFLAHPELTAESPDHASGNYGLLDQAAALAWVKRNIAAFGGDPRHITVGGESAGSMSVSTLMTSPLTRGLIAGAIGESGAMMRPLTPFSLSQAEKEGADFARGIGAADLAALRAIPAERLLAAQGQGDGFHASPTIDGYYLREPPAVTYGKGEAARVPLLVGSNSQEQGWQALLRDQPATLAGYRAALQRRFGVGAGAAETLFPAASDGDVKASATALAGDLFLGQATWKWFDLQRQTGAPTYYYYYARVRPGVVGAAPGASPAMGAVHSAEIEYALGNLHVNPRYVWTDEDRRTAATMSGYWANFVKTGDPNGPGLPAWPRAGLDASTIQRQVIDADTRTVPFPEQRRYVALESLIPPD